MSVTDIVRLDSECVLRERAEVPAEKLVHGDPVQQFANAYSDPGKAFHVGVWEGPPARWRVKYTEHEFCHIVFGNLRITDTHGVSIYAGRGDSFVIPAGFVGVWETLERTRKIYVIYEPSPAE